MDTPEGKDESSIKPVSSLRSRFESLQKDGAAPPVSPITGRLPFSAGGSLAPQLLQPTTPVTGTAGSASVVRQHGDLLAPVARPREPGSPASRPHSIVSVTPSREAPPLLTLESPHSPARKNMSVDLRQLSMNTDGFNLKSPGSESPTRTHARNLSRAASPGVEARVSALLKATEPAKPVSDREQAGPPAVEIHTKSQAGAPPPVNRAGKPKVPVKPTALAQALATAKSKPDAPQSGPSPFTTPPGSGSSSPRLPVERNRNRGDSNASFAQRMRADSDASFVERVPTNSSTSTQRSRFGSTASLAERARAGSNASFVEPSTLPDSWHNPSPPPMHHQATARREPLANGSSRPARYRPVASTEMTAAGDLLADRPRLPVRPELQVRAGRVSPPKARSGRTSPVKQIFEKHAFDGLKRATTFDGAQTPPRIPATKSVHKSALSQGFDRMAQVASASSSHIAPPVPATRKSMDIRREMPNPPVVPAPRRSMDSRRELNLPAVIPATIHPPAHSNGHSYDDEDDQPAADLSDTQPTAASDYPDSSQASRRPPTFKQRPYSIPTDYDTRTFAVSGEYVCTTGHRTKVWSLRNGEQLLDLEHLDIKVSSVIFKPSPNADDEGKRIWLGTSIGEIHELDVPSRSVLKTRANAHNRKDIIRMFRHAAALWTLDDSGDLNVWTSDVDGALSLDSQYNSFRTVRGHTFSIALGKHLWLATGKDIRVFFPGARSDAEFQVVWNPMSQPGTGEVYSGATLSAKPDLVYFGHQDGKVSIYNRHKFTCNAVVNVSVYKLSSMTGVGEYIWAGFGTGMAYVYDTSTTPWKVKKDWKAHEKQICGINADRAALWKMNRLHVVTLGTDGMLKIWDGMLEQDWLDTRMQEHDSEYCSFRDLTAAVLTWNAGATKPTYLSQNKDDNNFFRDYVSSREHTDIFVFGFQELVDLEDKKMTAKSFFKSKKKDANEQEHIGHRYRAWRDHLTKCLEDFMPPSQTYVLVHSSSLIGLFTCVFVKTTLRSRVKHVHAAEIKRGMGGHHGNKGALLVRMVLDDSSLCFINCHLAAGQTQTIHRNNDIAAILEAEALPAYPLSSDSIAQHSDVFTSGGDGSMILDHEICILNGDLNYRIDTMGRDTVIKHVNQNNLGKLLERDQLLLTKKRNPGFRLRAFHENEIRFAPTYKYNLHSDDYDNSEKRRAPAWCDRILYRGIGKVKMEEYRRWEVRMSDHRPVSGVLRIRVKTVDPAHRAEVWETCRLELDALSRKVARAVQLEYLTNVLGLSQKEAAAALR